VVLVRVYLWRLNPISILEIGIIVFTKTVYRKEWNSMLTSTHNTQIELSIGAISWRFMGKASNSSIPVSIVMKYFLSKKCLTTTSKVNMKDRTLAGIVEIVFRKDEL
jgi:hypothetical protein